MRILNNLITNEIKYNKKNGEIKISGVCSDNQFIISVEDTGEGIATANLQKIFEPFERLDHAGDIQGSGIGLTIVNQLVSLLQGQKEVKLVEGQGSVFSVYLPR